MSGSSYWDDLTGLHSTLVAFARAPCGSQSTNGHMMPTWSTRIRSVGSSGTILGLLAILFWSTTVAFGRRLTEQLGTLTAACLIYLLGGSLGCAYQNLGRKRRSEARTWTRQYVLGCGGLFVLYMVSLYAALGLAHDRRQVLEVGLLNYLWPTLTLIFFTAIIGLKASPLLALGVSTATVGVVLAMTQDQPDPWFSLLAGFRLGWPHVLGVVAAVSWALYSTLSRKWAGGQEEGAVFLFMLVTGTILGTARLFVSEHTVWTWRALGELGFMAVVPNLAYVFWDQAMRKGDIVLVASCSYLTPLLSTLTSCLYLGVTAGPRLWMGVVLVVLGAVVCRLSLSEVQHRTVSSG